MLEKTINSVFFCQEVYGKNGKPFTQYKLRTMYEHADQEFELYLTNGLDCYGKIPNDPRITKQGKFLRDNYIDELPQLLNILKGDMALVGVRPRSKISYLSVPEHHIKTTQYFKPGFLGIAYVLDGRLEKNKSDSRLFAIERLYVMKKKKKPLQTDISFAAKIIYNIIFKGVRSS